MTDSMVERVAMAILDSLSSPYAGIARGDIDSVDIDLYEVNLKISARAAIAAMREPTEAMITAGDIPEIVNCCGGCMAEGANPDLVWRAMVDEALK